MAPHPSRSSQADRKAPEVDPVTASVLSELQARFPLEARPYAVVGERLGVSEQEVFDRLAEARSSGHVRQVSAIFDTRSLGYDSSLVAMRVPAVRLERAVAVVNAHPGVSHNYLREHDFNLWFTIATPPGERIETVLAELHALAEAESIRALPTIRLFKIGVALDATGHAQHGLEADTWYSDERQQNGGDAPPTAEDIAFVRAAQDDLGGELEPFAAIAQVLHISKDEAIAQARRMSERGQLRRFAAILNHRRAGFRANGMGVWRVPEDRLEEVGRAFASRRSVTHCYQRPAYDDWPYNVFTMVHGSDRGEVEAELDEMAATTGIAERRVLYSTTEFKKIRLRLFTPPEARWRELCAAAATAGARPEAAVAR